MNELSLSDIRLGITVLAAPLGLCADRLGALERTLSAPERERARRLATPTLRRRYIAARGQLRELLGRRLGLRPNEVEITAGRGGKPRVDGGPHFNVAHSDELALFVFGPADVGVDVERLRVFRGRERIAAAVLTPAERLELSSLAPEERDEALATVWTRKEAYLKARGDGIAFPPERLAVTVHPALPPRLLWVADEPGEPSRWRLATFAPTRGYVGSVAVLRS